MSVPWVVWLDQTHFPEHFATLGSEEQDEVLNILDQLELDPDQLNLDSITIPEFGPVCYALGELVWVAFQMDRARYEIHVASCGRYRPPPLMM